MSKLVGRLLAALTIVAAAIAPATAHAEDAVTLYRLESDGVGFTDGTPATGPMSGTLTFEKATANGDVRNAIVGVSLTTADPGGPLGDVRVEGKGVLKLARTSAQPPKWKATLTLVLETDIAKPPATWGSTGPITFTGGRARLRADGAKEPVSADLGELRGTPEGKWPF